MAILVSKEGPQIAIPVWAIPRCDPLKLEPTAGICASGFPSTPITATALLENHAFIDMGWKQTTRTPCQGIKLPKETSHQEMRFLGAEEVVRLADAVEPRYRALIVTAAYAGLRWGELAALKVFDVNLFKGTIDVRQSLSEVSGRIEIGPTKTGARRTVSLPRFLAQMIGEHIGLYPSPEAFVFSAAEGGPLRRAWYRRHYLPAVKRAGLEPLRFPDLRHTCASLLIQQGAHVKEIAERLGHSTVRITLDTYAHLLPSLDERLREGLEETYQESLAPQARPAAQIEASKKGNSRRGKPPVTRGFVGAGDRTRTGDPHLGKVNRCHPATCTFL
jgi:site-specific recombinase XerD